MLSWNRQGDLSSVVYYFPDQTKEGVVLSITKDTSLPVSSSGFYCVTTINKDNKESEPSDAVEKKIRQRFAKTIMPIVRVLLFLPFYDSITKQ